MNVLYKDLCGHGFIFLGSVPRVELLGHKSGKCLKRNCQTIVHDDCINFHSCQQCVQVPPALQPSRHLVLSVSDVSILVSVQYYHVILIYTCSLLYLFTLFFIY